MNAPSRLLAATLVAALVSPAALAQRRGDFPSWEREVDPSIPDPLPQAPSGSFVAERAFELPAPALGVVGLGGAEGALAVAHVDGSVSFVDPDEGVLQTLSVAPALDWPPIATGGGVVVAGRSAVALVHPEGEVWNVQPPVPPAAPPAVVGGAGRIGGPAAVVLVGEDGAVALLDAATGAVLWRAALGGPLGAGPVAFDAFGRSLLAFGTAAGVLVSLDARTGDEAWRVAVGDAVTALTAADGALHGSAYGVTPRTPKQPGPHAFRASLRDGGPPRVDWRLRIGGGARSEPLVLGPNVAFAASGGYVHALDAQHGTESWRFDLPAAVEHPPVHAAGRLEYFLSLTPWAVAIAAENGGLMGWFALPDEDELFVGPAARSGGRTWAVTSLDRLLGLRFAIEDWPEPPEKNWGDRR